MTRERRKNRSLQARAQELFVVLFAVPSACQPPSYLPSACQTIDNRPSSLFPVPENGQSATVFKILLIFWGPDAMPREPSRPKLLLPNVGVDPLFEVSIFDPVLAIYQSRSRSGKRSPNC